MQKQITQCDFIKYKHIEQWNSRSSTIGFNLQKLVIQMAKNWFEPWTWSSNLQFDCCLLWCSCFCSRKKEHWLTGAERREWRNGMIIDSSSGSFPHSLRFVPVSWFVKWSFPSHHGGTPSHQPCWIVGLSNKPSSDQGGTPGLWKPPNLTWSPSYDIYIYIYIYICIYIYI